ncbi:TatD family hydrolase [Alkalibacter rhizosphaerae]|uniref:TatD family hydrolase n=1 Tax=Alkalibacter rhizosphaerae TaxID=2815577 RepID=A0A974XFP1_9FIRM|nr:TatD family hydrolase [Alkalibacter rhizosphaerae]QSX08841.1 TatD family hydrolase [Alkalibacter rhizosphaerae]
MFVDFHNHLHSYKDRLDEALCFIRKEGILTLDCTIHPEDYAFSRSIGRKSPYVISGFGIHPWEAHRFHENLEELEPMMKEAAFIGEIGLDFHWVTDKATYPAQRAVCDFMIRRSREMGKMCNLHTKGAETEVLALLKKYDHPKAVVHWYSGSRHVFDRLKDFGCCFTIGIDVHTSQQTKEMVEQLPLERILTETDGMETRQWLDGTPGFPEDIIHVVEAVAGIKGIPKEQVVETVYNTTLSLLKG